MISTSGYFKSVNCPFFQNGLCERPYCHFRHVKQVVPVPSAKVSPYLSEDAGGSSFKLPKPESEVHLDLLTMVQKVVAEEKARVLLEVGSFSEPIKYSEPPTKYSGYSESSKYNLSDGNHMHETSVGLSYPLNYESKYKMPTLKSKPVIPEYKPTPIAELQKRMGNKYRLSPKHRVNDMEYDPVSNFTTEFQSRHSIKAKSNVETKPNHSLTRQYSYPDSNSEKKKSVEPESKIIISPSESDDELHIDAKFSSDEDEPPGSPDTYEDLEKKSDTKSFTSSRDSKVFNDLSIKTDTKDFNCSNIKISHPAVKEGSNKIPATSEKFNKQLLNLENKKQPEEHNNIFSDASECKIPNKHFSKLNTHTIERRNSLADHKELKEKKKSDSVEKEICRKDSLVQYTNKDDSYTKDRSKIDSLVLDKKKDDGFVLDKRKDDGFVLDKRKDCVQIKSKISPVLDRRKDDDKNNSTEQEKSENEIVLGKKKDDSLRHSKNKDYCSLRHSKNKDDCHVQDKIKNSSDVRDKNKKGSFVNEKARRDSTGSKKENSREDSLLKDKSKKDYLVNEKDRRDSTGSKKENSREDSLLKDKSKKDEFVNEKDRRGSTGSRKENSREDSVFKDKSKKYNGEKEKIRRDSNSIKKENSREDSVLKDKSKKDSFVNEKARSESTSIKKENSREDSPLKHKSKKDNHVNEKAKRDSTGKTETSRDGSFKDKSKKDSFVNEKGYRDSSNIKKENSREDSFVKEKRKKDNWQEESQEGSSVNKSKYLNHKLKLEEKGHKSPVNDSNKRLKTSKSEELYLDKTSSYKFSKHLTSRHSKSQSNITHIDLFGEDSDDDKGASTKISTNRHGHNKNKSVKNDSNSETELNKNKHVKKISNMNDDIVIVISDDEMSPKYKPEKKSHRMKKKLSLESNEDVSPKRKKKHSLLDSKRPLMIDSDNEMDGMDTDLDEHDTYEECLAIFNETNDETSNKPFKNKDERRDEDDECDEFITLGRKRVAHHNSSHTKVRPTSFINSRPSPAQVMFNRYVQLQKAAEAAKAALLSSESGFMDEQSFSLLSTDDSDATSAVGKKRIAPPLSSSAGSSVLLQKKVMPVNTVKSKEAVVIPAPTFKGPQIRTARRPIETDVKKPIIPVEYGSKVPTNIRQRYLNVFCDECLKIYTDAEEAFERAKQEEQSVYDRSISRTVYLNVAVNAVKRLRNEAAAGTLAASHSSASVKQTKRTATTVVASQPASKKMSHEAILGGAKAAKTSYSVRPTSKNVSVDCLKDAELYRFLQVYLLSKEDAELHGFPQVCPREHGKAIILKSEVKQVNSSDPTVRCCARCGKNFRISFTGHYITKEECVYHWGKAWKKRINGSIEIRYTCCQGDSESDGCCLAKLHVTDHKDYDNLVGFVKTLPKTPPIDGDYGIYALDCEMCYTTLGSELTRVTVVDTHLKPVYEALVKPDNPIVDYNTRFSGLTEDDMKGVRTSLRDVQAVLLNKFNDKTILIGHSLESDFMALKLIHNTIVDTSVVFPHRLGLPYKRALRTLMAEYIKKIIQDDITGHDSQEDAAACIELMLWKIKEDIKKLLR